MYYRRKILLSLIQQFGGVIFRTDLQKLLFLLSQNQNAAYYHFVPHKYGCFSFQANQDILTMIKYNQIEDIDSKWKVIDSYQYINDLKSEDKNNLISLFNKFKDIKGDSLIKYVYEKYPYYAINSEIASKILNEKNYELVLNNKPSKSKNELFTIGYEGKTVEQYVNQLIKEDIKVLCDVRKNPLSMKYGFSKNQLNHILEKVGIKYLHIPQLGISSDKRQNLKSLNDYKYLFDEYEQHTLQNSEKEISELANLFYKEHRIALTCFEADFHFCHRSRVAEALSKVIGNNIEVQHI